MIAVISQYIQNIAMFVIFMAFIGIVLPDTKHKNYIDLVLGLVLILITLKPLLPLVVEGGPYYGQVREEEVADLDGEYYEGIRNELIRKTYTDVVGEQIGEMLSDTTYKIGDLEVYYNEETGDVSKISLSLEEWEERQERKFIRIERVALDKGEQESVDTEETKKIKKQISDFYNLSVDNIHITVQKEKAEGGDK